MHSNWRSLKSSHADHAEEIAKMGKLGSLLGLPGAGATGGADGTYGAPAPALASASQLDSGGEGGSVSRYRRKEGGAAAPAVEPAALTAQAPPQQSIGAADRKVGCYLFRLLRPASRSLKWPPALRGRLPLVPPPSGECLL